MIQTSLAGWLFLAAQTAAPADPAGQGLVHRYEHGPVTIRADFEAAGIARELAQAVGALVPRIEAAGLALKPELSLRFSLFDDVAAYDAAFGEPPPDADLMPYGFTDGETFESVLRMQPRLEPAYLAAVGAPERLTQEALHEAVHQCVMRSGCLPYPSMPIWITEGLCEHLAGQQLLAQRGADEPLPLTVASARNRVARALEQQRLMPLDELFSQSAETRYSLEDSRAFYDQSRSLVAFLLDPESGVWRARFQAFLDELRVRPRFRYAAASARERERIADRWRAHMQDQEALEAAWREWAGRTSGDWTELWESSEWVGAALVSAATRWNSMSLALHRQPMNGALELEFDLQVLPVGEGVACVGLYVRREPLEWVCLSIPVDAPPFASLYRRGKWRTLAFGGLHRGVGPGVTRVRVEVLDRSIFLFLDGKRAFKAAVDPLVLRGERQWGLGADRSAARYTDIQVCPAEAR